VKRSCRAAALALTVLAGLLLHEPQQAHASGGDFIGGDAMAMTAGGMALGALGAAGFLLTAAVVGVDFDGFWAPPPLAWTELGLGVAMTITALAITDQASVEILTLAMAGHFLAAHGVASLFAYRPARDHDPHFALTSDLRTQAQLSWLCSF
jgi:hypothetical protein